MAVFVFYKLDTRTVSGARRVSQPGGNRNTTLGLLARLAIQTLML